MPRIPGTEDDPAPELVVSAKRPRPPDHAESCDAAMFNGQFACTCGDDQRYEMELAGGIKIRSKHPITNTKIINATDIVGEDGMTDKERNALIPHGIELGSLVELSSGVRLFVVTCARDCDQTPMYWLCHCPKPLVFNGIIWANRSLRECLRYAGIDGGYAESSLKVIAGPEVAYAELDRMGYITDGNWIEQPYYGEDL